MTALHLGQFAVVRGGKVLSNLPQLSLNQVKVVHQPFGRRGEQRLFANCNGQLAVGGEKDLTVLSQAPRDESQPSSFPAQFLGFGETASVLFKAFDAEQL